MQTTNTVSSTLFPVGVVVLLALQAGCNERPPAVNKNPEEVTVSQPLNEEVVEYAYFTGHVEAVSSVELRARVTGYLDDVFFKDGEIVAKGDKLFEIDQKPYKAAWDQAKAAVSRSEAQLKTASLELNRQKELIVKQSTSQAEFDRASGMAATSAAEVESSKAQLEQAKINLDYTIIKSPIDGRMSRRFVDKGNLVVADKTSLTEVVSIDPIYVYFDVDDNTLLRVQEMIREGKYKSYKEARNPLYVGLPNELGFPHKGIVDFVDNKINAGTGTVTVRGIFDDADHLLTPGLFVRVKAPMGGPRKSLLVNEKAISSDQGQKYVLLVDDKNKVVSQRVRVGNLTDGLRVIEDGLRPTDWVITEGILRVRPGEVVAPKRQSMKRGV